MSEETTLETFVWRGQTRYRCTQCEFDGPTQLDVMKHIKKVHHKLDLGMGVTLFDADDKPIQREIVTFDE
jgi:hypothetical protein